MVDTTCSVPGCIREAHTRGWCRMHYKRALRNNGDPGVPGTVYETARLRTCSVDDCTGPHYAKGLCQRHWQRQRKHSSTELPPTYSQIGLAFLESLTESTGKCVTWPYARTDRGYGTLSALGERSAHRVSARLHHGPPPADKPWALHSCGKGHEGCVAPWHLYWGDHADNTYDRDVVHDTHARGSRSGLAILDEAKVAKIKARLQRGERAVEIALDYGVSKSAITLILYDINWRHVPWPNPRGEEAS